jgi:hypothetical protein
MPRADIKTKQAVYTLSQLHAKLAGKFLENERQRVRLKTAMLLMLQPGFNIKSIAAKRRNKSNPWFKRGTLFRSAVDVLRRAGRAGSRDCQRPDRGQGRASHPQAVRGPTGGYPCGVAETGWRRGGRRWRAGAVAVERGRQLRRPLFYSFPPLGRFHPKQHPHLKGRLVGVSNGGWDSRYDCLSA